MLYLFIFLKLAAHKGTQVSVNTVHLRLENNPVLLLMHTFDKHIICRMGRMRRATALCRMHNRSSLISPSYCKLWKPSQFPASSPWLQLQGVKQYNMTIVLSWYIVYIYSVQISKATGIQNVFKSEKNITMWNEQAIFRNSVLYA